ncbi:MAG: hypothetical protein BWK73_49265 [Thiothrix lacustris]|uniref:Cyanobacterial TRADD-N associated 2 transmembrane domain-containing protein n=1 Tax=Thiothrix lacustris TaxID=525917 RepID=A0A1Y1Q969_9GAMM|nr:MAG: hypothetical protein BWK73_49265 [Thiothrix lacustris]
MNTDDRQSGLGAFLNMRQEAISGVTEPALKRLTEAASGDVKEIAASQIELLSRFYDLSLSQAGRSFRWALIASVIGLLFFLAAIGFMVSQQGDVALISVIGGAMVQFIAGVNFFLYGKTLSQLTLFQGRLEVTQRFLLANSLCESLEGKVKHYTRARLIGALAGVTGSDITKDLVDVGVDLGQMPPVFEQPQEVPQTTPLEADHQAEVAGR